MAKNKLSDCPASIPKGRDGSRHLSISFPGAFQLLEPSPLICPGPSGHLLERQKEEATVLVGKSGRWRIKFEQDLCRLNRCELNATSLSFTSTSGEQVTLQAKLRHGAGPHVCCCTVCSSSPRQDIYRTSDQAEHTCTTVCWLHRVAVQLRCPHGDKKLSASL